MNEFPNYESLPGVNDIRPVVAHAFREAMKKVLANPANVAVLRALADK